ncbi:MAG: PEGA domain-containing protein [Planctomycetia bacterium]|nr:PEGA domain-containing protein [Planctomycetia bacterium]
MKSLGLRALALAAFPILAGCDSTRSILINSEPAGAFIQVDGQNAGNAPITQTFDFGAKYTFVVTGSMTGYFTEEVVLTKKHPAVRTLEVKLVLQEDEAWKATTTSEATNAWLRIQVDPKLTSEQMWQKLIDAVTSAYSSLEQMDSSSGYIRSVATVRKFRSPKGQISVRTRFTGSIAQKEPLLYKLKIEAEVSTNGSDWSPYSRVFKEDEALIEELQSRLGTK